MNVRIHHAVSDIDGKTGMDIIGAIAGGQRDPAVLAKLRDKRCKKTAAQIAGHLTGTWRDEHLFTLGQAYKTLGFIDGQIAEYDGKIFSMYKSLAEGCGKPPPPSPPEDQKPSAKDRRNAEEKRDLQRIAGFDLTVVPGIAYDTAAIVLSELGADFSRFPTERHFASYIGLAPSLGKSAGKNVRQRKRCKNTSRAGRALRMAASTLYKSHTEIGAFFRSVARRTDRKTAVKATARRMAHMIYRGVRYGVAYLDKGAEAFEARAREKAVKAVKNLIKTHGMKEMELKSALAAT